MKKENVRKNNKTICLPIDAKEYKKCVKDPTKFRIFLDMQIKENPELAEKLDQDILSSLQNSIESFEDFDLVFDCRGPYQEPKCLGTGGLPALNENRLKESEEMIYGLEHLSFDFEKDKILTLYGSGVTSALSLVSLKSWLEKDGNVLNLVTPESAAFKKFLSDEKASLVRVFCSARFLFNSTNC